MLVAADFLESTHGEIECDTCHGGDAGAADKAGAHTGLVPSPSLSDPEGACGECHEEIAAAVPDSLHRTLAPFAVAMKRRADKAMHSTVEKGLEIHCSQCHISCGGCHVSRPDVVEGGFVNGHNFSARPDLLNQCTACHGSRIGNEFLGKRGQGDVHARKANMVCVDCHTGAQLHAASPPDLKSRFHKAKSARCTDCHKDLRQGEIRNHNIHVGKVQCQVCHAQTYGNCYSCHTGKDDKGLPFYQNKVDLEGIKIGLAYEDDVAWGEFNYMLVRHIPVDPDLFAFYGQDVFTNFGATPSWKRTAPHNIQRKTWQTASCNHCHGNRDLFLSVKDLLAYEIEANRPVVVPDIRVPARIGRGRELSIDTSRVKTDWVVDADWLNTNLGQRDLVVVDARTAADYQGDHIEGAILIDPLREGQLRWPWDSDTPQELLDPQALARVFGDMGMRADSRIVVYDNQGWRAAFLLSILDYLGADRIAFLEGGMETWRRSGYPLSAEATVLAAQTFQPTPRPLFLADNTFVRRSQDNTSVAIVDIRPLDQSKGLTKHARALSAGRIPGSIKFPIPGLIMDHARLKPPEELLWVLRDRGITPNKTVVITCNTGAWAGAGFFMLRYLGYPDVRMHDAAWVGWEQFARYPGCGY